MNNNISFSNYSYNVEQLYKNRDNVLKKEFVDGSGQIQDKSRLWRVVVAVQTYVLEKIDSIVKTHLLQRKQEAYREKLLEKSWKIYQAGGVGGKEAKPIDERMFLLINKVTAVYARKIGDREPLTRIHDDISQWFQQSEKYQDLNPLEKEVLTAIYNSGISPSHLDQLHQGKVANKETLSTAAQVLNLYEKVAEYHRSMPQEDFEYFKDSGPGKIALDAEKIGGLSPEKIQELEKFVKRYNLLPQETLRKIVILGDWFLLNSIPQEDLKYLTFKERIDLKEIAKELPLEKLQNLKELVKYLNTFPKERVISAIRNRGDLQETYAETINIKQFLTETREKFIQLCTQEHLPTEIPLDRYGTPVPTQKQLEIAVNLSYRAFEDVPQFSTDLAKTFFARAIQYLLVGDKLGYVPYPKDQVCFTFKELQSGQETFIFSQQNFTLSQVEKERDKKYESLMESFFKDFFRNASYTLQSTNPVKDPGNPNRYRHQELKNHDLEQLKSFLTNYREAFLERVNRNDLISSFVDMREVLPVKENQYEKLIDSFKLPSHIKKEDETIIKKFLKEIGQLPGRNKEEEESWRVALLQFLLHMHQGLPSDLFFMHQIPLESTAFIKGGAPTSHQSTFTITPGQIIGSGSVDLVFSKDEEIVPQISHLPNYTEAEMVIFARFYGSSEIPSMGRIGGGPNLIRRGYERVLIPSYTIFQPELLSHITQHYKEPADFAKEAEGIVDDLNKINNDNLNAVLGSKKLFLWNEINVFVQCLELKSKIIPFFKRYSEKYETLKDYIELKESKYVIKKEVLPTFDKAGSIPPDQYEDLVKMVSVLNQMIPHLSKLKKVRATASLLKEEDLLKQLGWLNEEFVAQCKVEKIPHLIGIEENRLHPTAKQLEVAFAVLNRQVRGMPNIDSPEGKKFIARLTQLILAGPELMTSLEKPQDEFYPSTNSLEKFALRSMISAPQKLLTSLNEDLIKKRLNTFYNQNARILEPREEFEAGKNPAKLKIFLENRKHDFSKWITNAENRKKVQAQIAKAKQDWKMDDLSYEKIQSLFWGADLGIWQDPIRSVLSGKGTEEDQLWGFHLLQFALMSQTEFAVAPLATDVAKSLFPESNLMVMKDQMKGSYTIDEGRWAAKYTIPLGYEEGKPVLKVDLTIVQNDLYKENPGHQEIAGVKFAPLAAENIGFIEKAEGELLKLPEEPS